MQARMEECVCPHDVHVVYPNADGPYGLQNPTGSSPSSKPSQAFYPIDYTDATRTIFAGAECYLFYLSV